MTPHIQHRPQLSSLDDTDECPKGPKRIRENHFLHSEKFKKTKNDNHDEVCESIKDATKKSVQIKQKLISQCIYCNVQYILLIQKGFENIPERKKFQCSRKIISFIKNFIDNLES